MTTTQLTAADLELLEFERATWKYLGRKETVIRERFGHSMTRYAQRLQRLIDHPAARAYDPQLVARLTRVRTTRRTARTRGYAAVGGSR